ncbi:MAG: AraD1 family protein [Terracidiphilus sp.]
MHLVQIESRGERAVAIADGKRLRVLAKYDSVYSMALSAIREKRSLTDLAHEADSGSAIDYDRVYSGQSDWRLMVPLDHPADPARVMVSGTGLTHRVSAKNRAAMHSGTAVAITDSMRMYRLGKEGGRPASGAVGAQPEWFYKGTGAILKAHGEPLEIPAHADDGGEEAEIAGAYVIGDDGEPYRIGFLAGNEFSDHEMEQKNYLFLAHSKLRSCSVGPELAVGGAEVFQDVPGNVKIERTGVEVWKAAIYSGEKNMCHSLANLEHHHFKYRAHRRSGDVHIHFFGADAFSFGEGLRLQDGDEVSIDFPALGRPLRNRVTVEREQQRLVETRPLR